MRENNDRNSADAALLEWLLGFTAALPLFIQVENGFGLYSAGFQSVGLAIPIGLPFLFIYVALRVSTFLRKAPWLNPVFLPSAALALFFFLLGASTAVREPGALLYAAQWSYIYLATCVLLASINTSRKAIALVEGLFWGAFFASLLLVGILAVEVSAGTFAGRIAQNAVIPGMYQLYNYTPLALALSICLCLPYLWKYRRFKRATILVTAFLTLIAVAATGARGPLAVLLVAALVIFVLLPSARLPLICAAITLSVTVLFILLIAPELTIISKFEQQALWASGAQPAQAPRAIIAQAYLRSWLDAEWLFGDRMARPPVLHPVEGYPLKSAHNYYLDLLVWSGAIGFALWMLWALAVCIVTLHSFRVAKLNKQIDGIHLTLLVGGMATLIAVAGVSNLLRVPMRQPFTALIIAIAIAICCGAHWRQRRT